MRYHTNVGSIQEEEHEQESEDWDDSEFDLSKQLALSYRIDSKVLNAAIVCLDRLLLYAKLVVELLLCNIRINVDDEVDSKV